MIEPCCDMLKAHLNKTCDQHESPYDCDTVIVGPPVANDWGLPVHDGGRSYIKAKYCPFCGWPLGISSSLEAWFVRGMERCGCPDAENRGHQFWRHPIRMPLAWIFVMVAFTPELLITKWHEWRGSR